MSYSSDLSVSKKEEDRFQRFNFAKQIADNIIQRQDDSGLVFGIYGAWGEGKTSILNFIESELSKSGDIILLQYNPWRYQSEEKMLEHFFKSLSSLLDKSLSSGKEIIGNLLKTYGKLLDVTGMDVSEIGESMSEVTIETLKLRIEKILRVEKKKIVVIIDDIDRLDKREMHSLFRLVKLNGDFTNLTYILSFDEKMVAESLGDNYGKGGPEAGRNFLEKVIHVPLTIPLAQPESLKKYCFQLIEKIVNQKNIVIPEDEIRRFATNFNDGLLPKLDTPRLAVRYGNAISFSLSILNGEINMVDLMLLEGVKILYPQHYEFIRNEPEYFMFKYDSDVKRDTSKKEEQLKKHLERLSEKFSEKQREAILNLLQDLFPSLEYVFKNYGYADDIYTVWYDQKRICSPKYFGRYFTYSVLEGEVSEVSYKKFVSDLAFQNEDEVLTALTKMYEESAKETFSFKLRTSSKDFDWDSTKKIARALSKYSVNLQKDSNQLLFSFETSWGMTATFIYHLLKKHSNKNESLSFAKELLKESPMDYSFELQSWFHYGKETEDKIFSEEDFKEIDETLLEKALFESNGSPLFTIFPDWAVRLYLIWQKKDRTEMNERVMEQLNSNSNVTMDLVRAFTPTWRSSDRPLGFKSDLSKDYYLHLSNCFNPDVIMSKLHLLYTEKQISEEPVKWVHRNYEQNDLNIVRQFAHWWTEERTQEDRVVGIGT